MLPLAFTLPYFSTDIALHKKVLIGVAERVSDRTALLAHQNSLTSALATRIDRCVLAIFRLISATIRSAMSPHRSMDCTTAPISRCHATRPMTGRNRKTRIINASAPEPMISSTFRTSQSRQTAERINADGIDILIDLCGYMPSGRPDALALQARADPSLLAWSWRWLGRALYRIT